jgi:4-alpha-glucanotransferase
MNTPGTVGAHNWTFRLPWTLDELFSSPEALAMARELAHLARQHGRSG